MQFIYQQGIYSEKKFIFKFQRQNKLSEDGNLIENYIKKGEIVPALITVKLLINAIRNKGWN